MNEVGQQQTQEQEASPAVVYATSRCCHTSCLAPSSGRQGTAALGPGLVTRKPGKLETGTFMGVQSRQSELHGQPGPMSSCSIHVTG